jgi:hypothetical protein
MTGADIGKKSRELRPALKELFKTGYSRNTIVHHGRLDEGKQLVAKPLSFEG